MSDIEMRQAAEERLLTAELTAVMSGGVAATGGARRHWRQLNAAALVLLGVVVTFGVAWLARGPDAPAQGRPFDAVDPWYEREWPYEGLATLARPVRAEQAGPEVDTFAVTLRDEDSSELAAVLDRPVVRRLALTWRNDSVAANVTDAQWQRLVVRPELESLALFGRFEFAPARLRELRRLPRLRYLLLGSGSVTLDLAAAQALGELPMLRGLALASVKVEADGMRALGALPHLEFLGLSRPECDAAVLVRALPDLRSLRAMLLESGGQQPVFDIELLRAMAKLPRLVALDLCFVELDDAALAALPPRLELLGFGEVKRCTAAGIASLQRLDKLRTLRLRAGMPEALRPALHTAMRAAPLARFDLLAGTLDAADWAVLQQLPGLRRLTVGSMPAGSVFREVRACSQLEELTLKRARLPRPEDLAPLRDHGKLRSIVLDNQAHDAAPFPAEELAALRASLTIPIEVRQR